MDLNVKCKPFNARLTDQGCLRNKQRAVATAWRLKNSGPGEVLLIDDMDLDRLAGCSQCDLCNVGGMEEIFVNAVTRDVTIIVDEVLNWDDTWYTEDTEMQQLRRKQNYTKWNKKEEVKAYKRRYRKKYNITP